MRAVELPLSSTEDKIVDTMDLEHAISISGRRFDPGILAKANKHLVYG